MLQTVHAGFDRSPRSIHTIRMTHDRKTFFMSNMYHFFYFFCLQRFSCHFAVILKIQKSCRHDLYKIRSCFFCLQNSLMELFQIIKSTPHNGAIMPVFVDCKNRCAIINPIFRGQSGSKRSHSIRITTISYKRNLCFLICPQTLPHGLFVGSFSVQIHRSPIVYTIHQCMCVTFSQHSPSPHRLLLKELTDFFFRSLNGSLYKKWFSTAASI